MTVHRSLVVIAAVGILLTGCAAEKNAVTPSDSPTARPSASSVSTSAPEIFTMPTACANLLPKSRLDAFAHDGLVLLGGPDGLYGDQYLADETPEQQAGGITCIWGPPDTEISSVTVSIAPLEVSSRASTISSLTDQGLNEDVDGDAVYYWLQGDTDGQPAVVNVIRNDSWISVIETIGGIDFYDEAEAIAVEVHDLAYS